MKLKKPKYVHQFVDSRGKPRNTFRRAGQKTASLPWPMYTEAWWKAYHAALAGTPEQKPSAGASKSVSGTINALIAEYYQSSAFTSKAPTTRSTYRNQLEAFRKFHGDGPVREIKTKHIDAILGEIAKKSTAQAHKLKKRLTTLLRLAVKWGYREDNPMLNAERVQHKAKGYETWDEEDIAKFRAFWKVGTPQRIAMEILLYTGLRRSDAVRLGPQHIRDGRIVITARKTGAQLSIPIHSDFQAVLDTIIHDHLVFIATAYGAARSEFAFTNWIIEAAKEAGLPPHRSPHGLRKATCVRLFDAGCDVFEIMAITGHRDIKEVQTYIAAGNQKKKSQAAITKAYGAS
ncbi:tyrosine-type recombinase/integrase [Mesorhizobium sp. IMUNJ 23232]|uniref:tyrosine-type recombinase/integrase n=1 Tax=Mesorhizobium sp. IMUNJ 23232 TaxID=3376064 RepID=UPI00379A251B